MLDQSSTTLNPITRIVVGHALNISIGRRVNMAANHTLNVKVSRVADNLLLELSNKTDDVFNLGFDVRT